MNAFGRWAGAAAVLVGVATAAAAEGTPTAAPSAVLDGAPGAAPPAVDEGAARTWPLEAAEGPAPAAPTPRRWAAAAGFVAGVGPEFDGGSRIGASLKPGLSLRWGRVSLSSRSAFSVRASDGAARGGLRIELGQGQRWRSSLGLRWDSGRDEGDSPELRGLGDVRGTLRARLALGWRFDEGWRAGAAATQDLLGRGGGWQLELSGGRDIGVGRASSLGAGVSLGIGGSRWMQSRYGVTASQSAASGLEIYTPGTGPASLAFTVGGRTTLTPTWALFWGLGHTRLLGDAAASPITRERNGWGANLGVVARLF